MWNMSVRMITTNYLKRVLPRPLLTGINHTRWFIASRQYRGLNCEGIFSRIYSGRVWGGTGDRPYSGSGSEGSAADEYVSLARKLIIDRSISRVVDVGCGDFRIGKRLVDGLSVKYLGIDVVPALIEHNQQTYGCEQVSFQCLDATIERVPEGNLCLIRQVLQHLSNNQISRILAHTEHFPFRLVSEHLPTGSPVRPNRDKAAGPDIRVSRRSGVFLEHPPFSRRTEILLESSLPFQGIPAVVRSSLVGASTLAP